MPGYAFHTVREEIVDVAEAIWHADFPDAGAARSMVMPVVSQETLCISRAISRLPFSIRAGLRSRKQPKPGLVSAGAGASGFRWQSGSSASARSAGRMSRVEPDDAIMRAWVLVTFLSRSKRRS